jgi:hypothetical protein
MKMDSEEQKPRHPIGVVSRRTGLGQDVIRAWERRYGAVVPQRTDTGRRLYTDEDVVGGAQFNETTNTFRLSLIVPDTRWRTESEWEAAYRDAAEQDGQRQVLTGLDSIPEGRGNPDSS